MLCKRPSVTAKSFSPPMSPGENDKAPVSFAPKDKSRAVRKRRTGREILSIVVDWISGRLPGQAATSSTCSPFTNFIPASTRWINLNPVSLCQPCSASLQSL